MMAYEQYEFAVDIVSMGMSMLMYIHENRLEIMKIEYFCCVFIFIL